MLPCLKPAYTVPLSTPRSYIGQMVVSMAHVFSALLKKLPKVDLLDYCMAFKTISQTACISIQNHTNYVPIPCKIPCFAKGLSTLILRKTYVDVANFCCAPIMLPSHLKMHPKFPVALAALLFLVAYSHQ
jgi:hypothetical protein